MGQSVSTVTGEVSPEALGVTLAHEHIIHQISIHSGNPDNRFTDIDMLAEELAVFRKAGGGTVCDATPIGVGRNPQALQQISRESGLYIVCGVGLYQLDVWPIELRSMSKKELSDFIVRQCSGEETGIGSGFIGEIASHNEDHSDWRKYHLDDEERDILEAVADAQERTGLSVYTHASLGRAGVEQLRAIIDSGGDARRVIIGHCDAQVHMDIEVDLEYYQQILVEGACLGFDLFGWTELAADSERLRRVAGLVQQGYADRILLSTDTCRLSQLQRFGGRGFDYLFTTVLPGLRKMGVSEQEIRQMTVRNPARMLTRVYAG